MLKLARGFGWLRTEGHCDSVEFGIAHDVSFEGGKSSENGPFSARLHASNSSYCHAGSSLVVVGTLGDETQRGHEDALPFNLSRLFKVRLQPPGGRSSLLVSFVSRPVTSGMTVELVLELEDGSRVVCLSSVSGSGVSRHRPALGDHAELIHLTAIRTASRQGWYRNDYVIDQKALGQRRIVGLSLLSFVHAASLSCALPIGARVGEISIQRINDASAVPRPGAVRNLVGKPSWTIDSLDPQRLRKLNSGSRRIVEEDRRLVNVWLTWERPTMDDRASVRHHSHEGELLLNPS